MPEDREKKNKRVKAWKHAHRERVNAWGREYHQSHKKQELEYLRKYRKEHPDFVKKSNQKRAEYKKMHYQKRRDLVRAEGIKRNYGISIELYNKMLSEQNGKCYICGEAERENRNLSVDHDHKTNKVRRLLCMRCNFALGSAKESPIILEKMAAYLRQFSC